MATNHNDLVTVNVFLAALPPQRQGFGVPLYIVTSTGNSLNGDTVRSYGSPADAAADLTAGYITSTVRDAIVTGFAQQPRVTTIKVATAAVGAYDTAYATARTEDAAFYAVTIDSVDNTDILEVSAAIEAEGDRLFIAHSNDAEWLTTGLPAGLTALAGRERTAVIYHDIATEPIALAWACSRLVFDPDVQSAPWSGPLIGVQALVALASLTDAQRDFIRDTNNANVALPYGRFPQYVFKGVNISGRPIYEILTADWFRARVSEDFIERRSEYDIRGEKILVNDEGQAVGIAIVSGRLRQGEDAKHFAGGQTRATAETITADDLANGRLRFRAEAQIGVNAVEFTVNLYQDLNPLAEA